MVVSMLSLTVPLLALLAGSGASMPSSAAPPTPLALPCTEEMLKASQAGDKSLPIACRAAALGAGKELDLIGAHLSYGGFKNAKFVAAKRAELHGVNPNPKTLLTPNLTHPNFSSSVPPTL